MENIKSSMFISFITIMTLNMLLIFVTLYSSFFKVTDYTLIAGIIAFVGAIIGGSITLIGVTKTIEANKVLEEQKKLKDELMFLYPLDREIKKLCDHIMFEYQENHSHHEDVIRYFYKKFSEEKELYEYAQRGSLLSYSKLMNFKGIVDDMLEEIYYYGYVLNSTREEVYDRLINGLDDLEKITKNEIDDRVNKLKN